MSVIVDSNFILSGAADFPLRHPRIGWRTWTHEASPAAVTVSSEQTGSPGDAPLRPDTYERWQPESMNATWTVDLGQARDVSYVGIGAHTIGSSQASVLVEYSADNSAWDEFGEFAPGTDRAIMFLAEPVARRYWRITLTGSTAPQIGVIYIGPVLEVMRPLYGGHGPITLQRDTVLRNAMSRGGQFLGQNIRRKGLETGFELRNLTPEWVRNEFDPFIEHARRLPYFIAWRPSKYPNEVAYGWTPDDIQPSNSGTRDLMDVSFTVRGFDD